MPCWHLMFFPCKVGNGFFWRFGFGGDPVPASTRKGNVGTIRIEDLAASPTNEFIHITCVVGKQDERLKMFNWRTGIMAQPREGKIDAARIKMR